jgi:ATP-dependent Lon protease
MVRPETVEQLLGKPRFQPEVKRRTSEPGVATGLAWTPVGGDVLFVEAIAYPGDGKLQITGQLGDVMKESAAAALSYVRNLDGGLGGDVSPEWFKEHDLHLHVPAGAIPKDGPSAGITMATAIASRVTCRPVRSDTAMTGEITLTGMVLPIGGLKEKALAAQRAGIKRLIIPRRNERDIDDIPEPLRKKMTFLPVDTVDEVLDAALQKRARRSSPLQPG